MNKILTKLLTFSVGLAMAIGVGVALKGNETRGARAAEATFAPSDFSGQGTSGTGSEISATIDGVTFACDAGYGTTQIRCYKNSTVTISSINTITELSFSFSETKYKGGLDSSYTDLSTNSWEVTLSGQARFTSITVTYESESPTPTGYIVTYSANTTDCVTSMPSNASDVSGEYTLSTTTPIRAGYSFLGWSETTSGSTVTSINVADNTTVYAIWEASSYATTFVANTDKGTETGSTKPDEMSKDVFTVSSTKAALAQTEYRLYQDSVTTISTIGAPIIAIHFKGIASGNPVSNLSLDSSTNIGTLVNDSTKNASIWTYPTGTTEIKFKASAQARVSTITIQYSDAQGYAITYDYDEATVKTAGTTNSFGTVIFPILNEKTGFVFKGWKKTVGGVPTGDLITTARTTVTGDTSFKAIFNPIYRVDFDANGQGATSSLSYKNVEKGNAIGELPTATWDKHSFLGWKEHESDQDYITTTTIINRAITFKAIWVELHTITNSISDGATLSSTADVAHGAALSITITAANHFTLPEVLEVTMGNVEYTGFSYTSTDNFRTATFEITSVTGDIDIGGTCEEDAKYTVTYKSCDDEESQVYETYADTQYGGAYNLLTFDGIGFETESGYKFNKWDINGAQYDEGDGITLGSDLTVIAVLERVVIFDLTSASYDSASADSVTWVSNYVDLYLDKGDSSTDANNYLGGGNHTETRMYSKQEFYIVPETGVTIAKIYITCKTNAYATTLASLTWKNGSASSSGSVVTIIPTNGLNELSTTFSSVVYITGIEIVYSTQAAVEVVSTDRYVSLVGDDTTIEAEIMFGDGSEGPIQFTSSDEDVAAIDKDTGKLTGVGVGETTITVSATGALSKEIGFCVISDTRDGQSEGSAYNVSELILAGKYYGSGEKCYAKGTITSISSNDYFISSDPDVDFYNPVAGEGISLSNIEVGTIVTAYGEPAVWSGDGGFGLNKPTVTKIEYPDPTGLIIGGSMTKTEYDTKSNSWNPSGLTVTASFEIMSSKDVTNDVNWNYSVPTPKSVDNPSDTPFNLTVYATYGSLTVSTVVSVVVKDACMTIHEIGGGWSLVTDASTLSSGDEIVITNADSSLGAKAYSSGNNVKTASVTASGDELTDTGDAAYLTIESAGSGMFYINDGDYYWYAAGSTDNYLKGASELPTGTTLNNYKWTFTYSTDHMDIVATNSSNRNVMQYNPNIGKLFSCYATASQQDLQVYKRTGVYDVGTDLIGAVNTFTNHFSCNESGTNFDYTNWNQYKSQFTEAIINSYHLNRIVADEFGNKIEHFLATYDYVIRKYGSNPAYKGLDFLGRFDTNGINYGTLFKTNTFGIINAKVTNTSIIVAISSIVAIASFAGYFYYKKKKDN